MTTSRFRATFAVLTAAAFAWPAFAIEPESASESSAHAADIVHQVGNVLAVTKADTLTLEIYERPGEGDQWNHQSTLRLRQVGHQRKAIEGFGQTMTISATLIGLAAISKPEDDGIVAAYVRNADDWGTGQTLAPSDGNKSQRFGEAIATDGTTLWVGAPASNYKSDSGKVYSWRRHGRDLIEGVALTPPEGRYVAGFGERLAVLPEGLLIATKPRLTNRPIASMEAFFVEHNETKVHDVEIMEGSPIDAITKLQAAPAVSAASNYCSGSAYNAPHWEAETGDFGTIISYYCCQSRPDPDGWVSCNLHSTVWWPSPRFREP